jgi:hypothetical protein
MHVHGALFHVSIASPDTIEQLTAGEDALGVAHEEMQQAVFGRTESNLALTGAHPMTGVVELQALGLHHVGGAGRRGTPQNRLDARKQLPR